MKKINMLAVFLALIAITTFVSCIKNDPIVVKCDGSSPVYNNEVKNFIATSCISSSCHGVGVSSIPDISTYTKLEPYLTDGTFERVVLTEQTMPKIQPLNITELSWLKCWVDNGYPEN